MTRPNLVFIFADQHRHDALGCAGHPVVRTPNLDRLASEGVRFSRAWCQSPICQPSRGSLITGRYPHELGILRNFGPDFDPEWPTFMKSLQAAGYETAGIGKTHYYQKGLVQPDSDDADLRKHAGFVGSFGFDHVVEEFDRYVHVMDGVRTAYTEYLRERDLLERYVDQIKKIWRLTPSHWDGVTSPLEQEHDLSSFLTREALSWLDERTGERPFFLQLSYVQPHVPLMADPIWADYYARVPIERGPRELPEAPNEQWEQHLRFCRAHSQVERLTDEYVERGARQYYGMISLIDQCLGELLALLERRGFMENTWIVYSSDHGEMLGDHGLMAKFNFYHPSVQVPLLLRGPGGRTPSVCDELVELVDVSATLLDAAGCDPLPASHGRSLLPATRGESAGRDSILSEIQTHTRRTPPPTYRALRTERYRYTLESETGMPCELFDLEADPDELVNRVEDPAFAGIASELRDRLEARI
jgi:choline-sulfatase